MIAAVVELAALTSTIRLKSWSRKWRLYGKLRMGSEYNYCRNVKILTGTISVWPIHRPVKFYLDPLSLPELFAKRRFRANTYYAVVHMHESVQQELSSS